MVSLRIGAGVLLFAMSFAPFQCAREPDPNRRIEDEPAEVVYRLAERFKSESKPDARAETLKFLIERYPTSRFAKFATQDLAEMGQAPPPNTASPNNPAP